MSRRCRTGLRPCPPISESVFVLGFVHYSCVRFVPKLNGIPLRLHKPSAAPQEGGRPAETGRWPCLTSYAGRITAQAAPQLAIAAKQETDTGWRRPRCCPKPQAPKTVLGESSPACRRAVSRRVTRRLHSAGSGASIGSYHTPFLRLAIDELIMIRNILHGVPVPWLLAAKLRKYSLQTHSLHAHTDVQNKLEERITSFAVINTTHFY